MRTPATEIENLKELTPVTGVRGKSFYGKAYTFRKGTRIYLKSYDTIVGYLEDGIFHRTWGGYSRTTMRHVNTFVYTHAIPEGGKKWWDSLPVEGGVKI